MTSLNYSTEEFLRKLQGVSKKAHSKNKWLHETRKWFPGYNFSTKGLLNYYIFATNHSFISCGYTGAKFTKYALVPGILFSALIDLCVLGCDKSVFFQYLNFNFGMGLKYNLLLVPSENPVSEGIILPWERRHYVKSTFFSKI